MSYTNGCLMIKFTIKPEKWHNFIKKLINPEDLYTDEEGFGIEKEPHCTLLYGINHDKFNLLDTVPILKKLNQIKVWTDKIDIFENIKYDVLKFNINSPDLHTLNTLLTKNFDYVDNHFDYSPHITIAYLKPKMGSKYIRNLSKPYILTPSHYIYSTPNGEKIYFTI